MGSEVVEVLPWELSDMYALDRTLWSQSVDDLLSRSIVSSYRSCNLTCVAFR